MSAVTSTLTLDQFRERYGDSDRIEFWDGTIAEKAPPAYLHALVQGIIYELLKAAGYRAVPEVRLRIGTTFEPVPDVAAGRKRITTDYPTTSDQIEIVVEVLSPEDRTRNVAKKCRFYQSIGIACIYVVNPVDRLVSVWSASGNCLRETEEWDLPNGRTILMADLWRQVDQDNGAAD